MFSLKNFRSYQQSLVLYHACEKLKCKAHVRDQLSRASLSVCLNLAEGSAKPTQKDRIRFYAIALASLRETQTILEVIQAPMQLRQLADQLGAQVYKLVHAQQAVPAPAPEPGPASWP